MWQIRTNLSPSGKGIIYQILREELPLSFGEVFQAWQNDLEFVRFYCQLLAQSEYEAFFWEHPALTQDNLDSPYEFILIEAAYLAQVKAQPHTFAEHYTDSKTVVSFPNLGNNARLVVPVPVPERGHYPSLAAFIRRADEQQLLTFWQSVAYALGERLGPKPCWLSTAGMGVYWLHVRLDDRPKYYRHKAYKLLESNK
ncbi:MAG: hypothetical protein AB8H47_18200 [Bacteroidia bacterium]